MNGCKKRFTGGWLRNESRSLSRKLHTQLPLALPCSQQSRTDGVATTGSSGDFAKPLHKSYAGPQRDWTDDLQASFASCEMLPFGSIFSGPS